MLKNEEIIGRPMEITRKRWRSSMPPCDLERYRLTSAAYKEVLDRLFVAAMVPEDDRFFVSARKVGPGFMVTSRIPMKDFPGIAGAGAGFIQLLTHFNIDIVNVAFSVGWNELEDDAKRAFEVVAR